jgi:hypothetical protein
VPNHSTELKSHTHLLPLLQYIDWLTAFLWTNHDSHDSTHFTHFTHGASGTTDMLCKTTGAVAFCRNQTWKKYAQLVVNTADLHQKVNQSQLQNDKMHPDDSIHKKRASL